MPEVVVVRVHDTGLADVAWYSREVGGWRTVEWRHATPGSVGAAGRGEGGVNA